MNEESRIAIIAVIVEKTDSVSALNSLLHTYSDYIVGRMGIPYRQKHVNIMSIAVDAPESVTSALAGKIGVLDGVSVKTVYSGAKG